MNRLPHGYTNESQLDGDHVVKRYVGHGAHERCRTEQLCLHAFDGLLPVPRLIGARDGELTMQLLSGRHGQELIAEGHAEAVLCSAGSVLWRIHDLPKHALQLGGQGQVVVHGDFGPQNLLLSEGGDEVLGVLDWECAHFGDPVEDLAWAEWIVRMHHPDSAPSLRALFEGYGEWPPWPNLQALMVRRCEELAALDPVPRGATPATQLWTDRSSLARAWAPLPDESV